MKTITIAFFLGVFAFSSVKAEDKKSDRIDDTIAAGIAFKIHYVLAAEGPWSKLENNNPEEAIKVLETIQRDLDGFSDTAHGKMLKTKGGELIGFMLSLARNRSVDDPVKVATRISELISEYAKASGTPDWVYDKRKREQ